MAVANGYLGLIGGKTWINQGTLTVGGDDLIGFGYYSGGNNTLTNAAGATLNLSSSNGTPLNYYGGYGGTATLNNYGTLNQTATSSISISGSIAFNSTGTVNVSAGTLTISSNGTDTGTYNISAGTT